MAGLLLVAGPVEDMVNRFLSGPGGLDQPFLVFFFAEFFTPALNVGG